MNTKAVPAVLAATLVCLTTTAPAWAHGGGLDSYGCHHDRKRGGYHCHRGEFAGQAFRSQVEMLQQRRARSGPSEPSKQTPATGTRTPGSVAPKK